MLQTHLICKFRHISQLSQYSVLLILSFLSSQFLHWLPCLLNPRPFPEHILSENRSFWESRLSTFLQLSFPVRSCIHFLSPCDIISLLNKERR
nr:MAG TPA: hypothetical protein [Caudoviricetes sp.]